jgi:hypothetical protein
MKNSIIAYSSFLLLWPAAASAGQDVLASAKTLYESASYEAALTELNALDSQQHRDAIDTYRALCFLGLGRTPDAEQTLEVMVRRQPLLSLSEEEYSPRIVALFRDVRKRVLPLAAQQMYASAKADFENKNYAAAAPLFRQTLDVIADIDPGEQTTVLADLKQLAEGFLMLAEGRIAPQPTPVLPTRPAAAPPPPAATPAAVMPAAVAAAAPTIYSVDDQAVTPPVVSEQRLPAWNFPPGPFDRVFRGLVETIIDETGAVETVTLLQSVWPPYDSVLLQAAKRWRYRPALKDGKPVKFRRVLDVSIDPKLKPASRE